jgi:hypothetical protein
VEFHVTVPTFEKKARGFVVMSSQKKSKDKKNKEKKKGWNAAVEKSDSNFFEMSESDSFALIGENKSLASLLKGRTHQELFLDRETSWLVSCPSEFSFLVFTVSARYRGNLIQSSPMWTVWEFASCRSRLACFLHPFSFFFFIFFSFLFLLFFFFFLRTLTTESWMRQMTNGTRCWSESSFWPSFPPIWTSFS